MNGTVASSPMTLESLPEFITIVDLSNILRMDLAQTRRFVKRNQDRLRPFKAGREVRCLASNFKGLIDDLQAKH